MEAFARHLPWWRIVGVDIAAPDYRPNFIRRDLTEPLDVLGRRYDLVVCLEVGEHLPEEAAGTLVESLVRHGDTVLFSAAVPGQAGKGHINCQPHGYWHGLFDGHGYAMSDTVRPLISRDGRVSPWYRDNIFLYRAAG
jgi:hypothetical protein